MKHKFMLAPVLLVGALLLAVSVVSRGSSHESATQSPSGVANHKSATYMIETALVTLADGVAQSISGPEAALAMTTQYFGNDLMVDLNSDGQDDVVFLVTQDGGGSGTFFYLLAALKTADGYVGSEAYFIGDRITPQSIERGADSQVTVRYLDRALDEPMTATPAIDTSMNLVFDGEVRRFREVIPPVDLTADTESLAESLTTNQ